MRIRFLQSTPAIFLYISVLLLSAGCGEKSSGNHPDSNHPPVAYDQSASILVNGSGIITLEATDEDHDLLNYRILTPSQHGTLERTEFNKWKYTPETDYEGPDGFTFKANDGINDSRIAEVSIIVSVPNHPPEAEDGVVSTDMNQPVDVLLDVTDDDGDTLIYEIIPGQEPTHGLLEQSDENPALWTYTPEEDYYGDDQFRFKANDGLADSNVGIITITIGYTPTLPVIHDLDLTTAEDVAIENYEFDAEDEDGQTLEFIIVDPPQHGEAIISGSYFTYIPDENYHGTDFFTVKANDGYGDSETPATISISIETVNDEPIALNDTVPVFVNETATFELNGEDVDGQSLTFHIVEPPSHGSLNTENLPVCIYTPEADYRGTDTITFYVKDSDGQQSPNTATVTFAVRDRNIVFLNLNAGGTGDGKSWDNACTTLQEAVNIAEPGNQIWIAKGTYTAPVDSETLLNVTTDSLLLYGGFDGSSYAFDSRDTENPNQTVLDGDSRVFHVIETGLTISLNGITIRGGKATGENDRGRGGGILSSSGTVTMNNCVLEHNEARDGGALYIASGELVVTNTGFNDNLAANGGSLYLGSTGEATLENTQFTNNQATMNGGSVFTAGNSILDLINCTFKQNSSTYVGGACSFTGEVHVNLTHFIQNESEKGGAVYDYTGLSTYDQCTFLDNEASADGGGLIAVGSIYMIDSTIKDNIAERGGGIYIDGTSISESDAIIFEKTTIKNNESTFLGGGIYITESTPIFKGCTIFQNKSHENGGGIACYSNGNPDLTFSDDDTSTEINDNESTLDGGGLFSEDSSPILHYAVVRDNTAEGRGGGIFITEHSTPSIDSSKIYDNIAHEGGGGFYIADFAEPHIRHSEIRNNLSDMEGGGIYSHTALPRLFNNLIYENRSNNHSGGAIFSYYSGCNIINCTIANNRSHFDVEPDDGVDTCGGIASDSGSANRIINSIIYHNYVTYGEWEEGDDEYNMVQILNKGASTTEVTYTEIIKDIPIVLRMNNLLFEHPGNPCIDTALEDHTASDLVTESMYTELMNRSTTDNGYDITPLDMGYHCEYEEDE